MRRPMPNLMVASAREIASCGRWADDIFDCTPEGVDHPHRDKVLHLPPTGGNSHKWSPEDLDVIVELAEGCLDKNRRVIIHCGRGVSRSTCAAAAVLLHRGVTSDVDDAVARARNPERQPVATALASLRSWWVGRESNRRQGTLC